MSHDLIHESETADSDFVPVVEAGSEAGLDSGLDPTTADSHSALVAGSEPVSEPINDPEPDPVKDPDSETDPDPAPEQDPDVEPLPAGDPEPDQAPVSEPGLNLRPDAVSHAGVDAALKASRSESIVEPVRAPESVTIEPSEPEESFGDIFSAFQRINQRREGGDGRQIRGTVVKIDADTIYVDIGFKSEGILPLSALGAAAEKSRPGDALMVSVKGRDADGFYELSLFRTAQPRDWSGLEKAFEDKSTIVGTVSAVVKGGLHVDVGVRAFLPASRSGARDSAEMEKLIGQEIRCRITKLDIADEDVVVDRRIVTEEEAQQKTAQRYSEVEVGAVLNGTVRSVMEYGAFVDLGGVDGLVHVSDLSWARVDKPADVVSVGQQVEVKVLKIDPDSRRISLGIKQLQVHPWDALGDKYKAGDRVRGIVTRTTDFGAFVEIEPGVEGLIHLSEMSWAKRVLKATEVVQAADVVEAVILNISLLERRISLGLKQALGDPWAEAATRLAPGAVVEGPVTRIAKFGVFVQVADSVEGLVHISEIDPIRRLNHPSDVLHAGQVVKAVVIELDREKRQMKLSIKRLTPTGLDEFLAEHRAGDLVSGRVASIEGDVARVELGEGIVVTCVLPVQKSEPVQAEAKPEAGKVDLSAFSSMLKSKWKTGGSTVVATKSGATGQRSELVREGQVRSFRITALDPAAKLVEIELAG